MIAAKHAKTGGEMKTTVCVCVCVNAVRFPTAFVFSEFCKKYETITRTATTTTTTIAGTHERPFPHLGVVPRRRHLDELLGLLRRGGILLTVVPLALLAVGVLVVVVVVPVTAGGILLVLVVVVPVRVIVRAPLVAALALFLLVLGVRRCRRRCRFFLLRLLPGFFLLRLLV